MSSIVDEQVLERLASLDLKLFQRFPRRVSERMARLLARTSTQWGPKSSAGPTNESDSAYGACLGGLEVSFNAGFGSTVTVTRGSMSFTNNARTTEARPFSYSGNVEPDDDDWTIYDLAQTTNVTPATPATPIAGALVQAEWWIVYGVIAGAATVESDSNRKVFNEVNGNYDPTTFAKIKGATFTPAIYRGAGGGTLAAASAAVSALTAAPPIAFIWVPIGSTDLSSAEFFDCRKLVYEDRGANRVEGTWTNPTVGTVSAPFAGKTVFQGVVRARLGGEWLECRALGLDLVQIASPGQTWQKDIPFGGAPQIAWLYLAKVQGLVPRLRAVGVAALGSGLAGGGVYQSGVLVLSPVPPRIRAANPVGKGALRWDLRNSASIALPTVTAGAQYPYIGCTAPADDAICVGFMLYSAVDGGSGLPMVFGPAYCGDNGWISGPEINALAGVLGAAASTATPTADVNMQCTITVKTITVLGDVVTLPIDGVRSSLTGATSTVTQIFWGGGTLGESTWTAANGAANAYSYTGTARALYPGQGVFQTHVGVLLGGVWNSAVTAIVAVRFPYGEPLVT